MRAANEDSRAEPLRHFVLSFETHVHPVGCCVERISKLVHSVCKLVQVESNTFTRQRPATMDLRRVAKRSSAGVKCGEFSYKTLHMAYFISTIRVASVQITFDVWLCLRPKREEVVDFRNGDTLMRKLLTKPDYFLEAKLDVVPI